MREGLLRWLWCVSRRSDNTLLEPQVDAFRDWAQMDTLPESMRAAIKRSVQEKGKGYESDGTLTIPNPAILVSAL